LRNTPEKKKKKRYRKNPLSKRSKGYPSLIPSKSLATPQNKKMLGKKLPSFSNPRNMKKGETRSWGVRSGWGQERFIKGEYWR